MQKHSYSRGVQSDRSRNGYGNQRPEGRPVRPQGLVEQPALASAIRLKNFKQLFELAGEDNLSLALDLPLQRVRELMQGVNFSDETTFHLETTLRLPSGYFDQVNPHLSEENVKILKSPLEQTSTPEMSKEAQTEQENPVTLSDKVLAPQAAQPTVTLASAPTITLASSNPPEAPPGVSDAEKAPAPVVVKQDDAQLQQSAEPAKAAAPKATQAKTKANAVAESSPVDSNELKLREVRRLNLGVITQQPGSKSHLARLVDMSPANISHRLHGNKHFDENTAKFFCEKLHLPEGWFNEPHEEADVPAEVLQMLGGSPRSNVASNRGGRPSKKPRQAADNIDSSATVPIGAPAAMDMPATSDAGHALHNVTQAHSQQNQAPVPETVGAGAPTTGSTVRLARGTSTRAALSPVSSGQPQTMQGSSAQAMPSTAAATAPSPIPAILEAGNGAIGPVTEALIKTLALKSRQGLLSEAQALRLLTETMSL